MKHYLFFLGLSCSLVMMGCASVKQPSTTSTLSLNQYSFSVIDSLMAKEPRPVAVFLHTDWCKYCHTMSQTTLTDNRVVGLLNRDYYFISFDAEQKEAVYFRNHLFEYEPRGRTTGTHGLAKALGTIDGGMTYPSFVLLNTDYEIVFQYDAFLNRRELKKILEAGPAKQGS